MEKFYWIDEISRILRVSRPTVARLIKNGDLPAIRVGTGNSKSRVLIGECGLLEFIERKRIFTGGNGRNEGSL